MPETSLVVVDPGHFHATLVQQEMYPELSPVVRVYAPLGPDLIDYLSRIARYNRRPQAATDWRLDVHAGPDFLDRIRDEPPGGVAIFSGRNRGKIDRIIAALEAGLHVLADKPAIVEPADLPRLGAALTMVNEQQLVLADMMTGRHNTLVRLLQALRCDPEVFGDPVPGTRDEPGVVLSGVHYLRKAQASGFRKRSRSKFWNSITRSCSTASPCAKARGAPGGIAAVLGSIIRSGCCAARRKPRS